MAMSKLQNLTGVAQPEYMSREQYNYAAALALYQTAQVAYIERTEHIQQLSAEADSVFDELDIYGKAELVRQAEDVMIAWAVRTMKRTFTKEQYRQIAPALDVTRVIRSGRKQTLVDICFQFRIGR